MADWKENKIVGIVAGVVFVLCLIIVIKVVMGMRPEQVPLAVEQMRSIEPQAKIFIPQK